MSPQLFVGPYRLQSLIRSGRNCDVFDVVHETKQERMAIKVLSPEAAKDREEVAFLKHEFTVGQPLDHPHVIKIHEFGQDGDRVYLAMELFASPNVKQLINQGIEALAPLAPEAIRKAAEGLHYFHTQGWVHRDIKPDNFLMSTSGDVKLIDFALAVRPKKGLAKFFAGRSKIQGTRSYMSPEQIRGEPLDQRADIYSFGCLVHELVGGKPPYTGNSTSDLLNKHLRAAIPPLGAMNQNVTEEFALLVRRMLAKKPEDRPQSLEDFLNDLKSLKVFKVTPKISQKA